MDDTNPKQSLDQLTLPVKVNMVRDQIKQLLSSTLFSTSKSFFPPFLTGSTFLPQMTPLNPDFLHIPSAAG